MGDHHGPAHSKQWRPSDILVIVAPLKTLKDQLEPFTRAWVLAIHVGFEMLQKGLQQSFVHLQEKVSHKPVTNGGIGPVCEEILGLDIPDEMQAGPACPSMVPDRY